jgi:hypothetical protein
MACLQDSIFVGFEVFIAVTMKNVITTRFLDFVHRPEFHKQGNTTFRKLDLFPSSGEAGHLLYKKP